MSSSKNSSQIKGQGAIENISQRFMDLQLEQYYEDLKYEEKEGRKTKSLAVFPKTIVNQNKGKNLPEFSMNPYQGCEHGCSYCYARPTHEFWGYNPGIDFERKILYKPHAAELLSQYFQKRNYQPKPIMLSGNTDCYQPLESQLQITRSILHTFLKHQHPCNIVTKNALVLRDLDILKSMAEKNLISVTICINSLNEELRRKMEPRTSSIRNKLKAIEVLHQAGIPTGVLIAPIIPALNSHEVFEIVKRTAQVGSQYAGYTIIRLNDGTAEVFSQWLELHFPDRAQKVLNQIRSMHQGELGHLKNYSNRSGTGKMVESIKHSFQIAKKKYYPEAFSLKLNCQDFKPLKGGQLSLF